MKYNFANQKFNFNGGLEGKILGEIEISLAVRFVSKKRVEVKPERDEHSYYRNWSRCSSIVIYLIKMSI
ncbi:hypothetical protein V3Q90_08660 [Flavobacterium oreochromis]|uniref:Uncharacterized protein n=1 Tax=Flavobacterium columnare TaxID=996 RepID=A0A246G886_9FLAO|nr:hypothetical protein BWK62_12980 [Flavobacterium oreochromis]